MTEMSKENAHHKMLVFFVIFFTTKGNFLERFSGKNIVQRFKNFWKRPEFIYLLQYIFFNKAKPMAGFRELRN